MANTLLYLRTLIFILLAHVEYGRSHSITDFPTVEDPVVRIEQGLLRGELMDSAAGGLFYSFKGIPYAQPPLGPLRFKDAEPPQKWQGIRNGTFHGNICMQPTSNIREVIGDEDCLYLNVYTPRLVGRCDSRLPVMFWIHGGGYITGSGNSDMYGPDYLLSEMVVVVTINYRLGALGFLYLYEEAPGNVGMKDQVAALRWVQKNIAAFGGDPDMVTIFGESAGAASVQLLVLSPLTRGLFSAAIAQSGHVVNNWAKVEERARTSLRLAESLGCGAGDDAAIVTCLRAADASAIVAATVASAPRTEEILPMGFLPTLDLKVQGVENFLPAPPIELIMKQSYHAVPFIMGFNNKEAYYALRYVNLFDELVARQFDSPWFFPILRLKGTVSENTEALQTLRNFYMQGLPLTNETIPGFMDMLTDIAIAEGIYFSLKFISENHKAPMYEYSFIVDDQLNVMKPLIPVNFTGAAHADDIGYIFHVNMLPDVATNSSAALVRSRVVRLWTNFAKYRVPVPYPDHLLKAQWFPYTRNAKNFLEIGATLRADEDLNFARVLFWENFYHSFANGQE